MPRWYSQYVDEEHTLTREEWHRRPPLPQAAPAARERRRCPTCGRTLNREPSGRIHRGVTCSRRCAIEIANQKGRA